jgi:hypothetical protein
MEKATTKDALNAAHACLIADGFTHDHPRFDMMKDKWAKRLDAFSESQVKLAMAELAYVTTNIVTGVLSLNDARAAIGLPPHEDKK